MDGYLICWRITNADGIIANHWEYQYPLGLDMWWENHRLRYLTPQQSSGLSDMRIVSSTIMRSVLGSAGGSPVLRFEGKSSPMEPTTPWSFLRWCPELPIRDDSTPAHHLMLRFGEAPPVECSGPIRKPGPNCPAAVQYLVYRSDLGIHNGDNQNNHRHESCYTSIPVGIFWGLLGLRSLNRWRVVRDMLQESLWFGTNGPPGSDPEPYRPVTAVLPEGYYLKVWIGVPTWRGPLKSCFFKFSSYGEILVDDDPSFDDDGSDTEREDNGDSGDEDEGHSGSFQYDTNLIVAAAASQVVRHGHAFVRKSSSSSGRSRSTKLKYSSQEGSSQSLMVIDKRGVASRSHPIPESLLLDKLYLLDEPLARGRIYLRQSKEQRKDLLYNGTGLQLEYLPSTAERYEQGYGSENYQRDQAPREYRERKREGERRQHRRATFDQFPVYPQARRPQEFRGNFPLVPAGNFEAVDYEPERFNRRVPDDYAEPDDDASHYSSSGRGRHRFDDQMDIGEDETSQSSAGTDSYFPAIYEDDAEGSVYGDTADEEDIITSFRERGPPGRRSHTNYPTYHEEDTRAAEEARAMAMVVEDDRRRHRKRHR